MELYDLFNTFNDSYNNRLTHIPDYPFDLAKESPSPSVFN